MKYELIQGDITTIQVDAIVNAANSSLMGGGGVDGAIHHAGGPQILEECMQIRDAQGDCPQGQAVITNAGNLPAKRVIHTVGPIWKGGQFNEDRLLESCYQNSLRLADDNDMTSIAFPNISTGIFRFPKDRAAHLAWEAVQAYFQKHKFSRISYLVFVCFDDDNYRIYNQLIHE